MRIRWKRGGVFAQYLLMEANLQLPWSRAKLMMISHDLSTFRGYIPIESISPIYLDLPGNPNANHNVLCRRRELQNTSWEG